MDKKKKIILRALKILLLVCLVPLFWSLILIFVTDSFVINGASMEPTLHSGQRVWVNKLLMGPRLYTRFDFRSPNLHSIRLPGIRRLQIGDVAIFNYPYALSSSLISFRINHVYCKRCLGTPGDTVLIKDCSFVLNDDKSNLQRGIKRRRFQIDESVSLLRSSQDSVLIKNNLFRAGLFADETEQWTIKNMGPIVVPKRGMTIELDSIARKHYNRVITWERRSYGSPQAGNSSTTYTFQHDWYFFVGDNLVNSVDSRHFGFVPADFVVGIVSGI